MQNNAEKHLGNNMFVCSMESHKSFMHFWGQNETKN